MKKINQQKKLLITICLVGSLLLGGCSLLRPSPKPISAATPAAQLDPQQQRIELNKKIVLDFYQGVFIKHQVSTYADLYLAEHYIQHNPHVADGKSPFVKYFKQYFKQNPEAKNQIKRVIASDNLVVLHVHSTQSHTDRGQAIIDIFRVEDGKIVEHWDVIQAIPAQVANSNTMF